jgi:uncharacterized phage-associated protein
MNHRKALEAILWCTQKNGGRVDFHKALKVLFGAEVAHLNRWGRPIIGDTFKAMQDGPVALGVYELMKREPLALEALADSNPPIVRDGYHVEAGRDPDLTVFSPSEIAALEQGWAEYGHLTFRERIARSHEHPAWANAWDAGGVNMDYADFLEGELATPEAKADLAEMGMSLKI